MNDKMKKLERHISLPLLGGVALLGVAALMARGAVSTPQSNAESVAAPAQPAQTAEQKAEQKAAAEGYRPSKFPGVMVRSVPSPKNAKSGAQGARGGWIRLKPGAKRPANLGKSRTGNGILRTAPGRSRAGGTVVYLDRSVMPYTTAKRGANGKTVLNCEHDQHPHSATQHAAHQSAPAKSTTSSAR